VHKRTSSKLRQRLETEKKKSLIDDDELLIHSLYRERIVQEDNLINHRMMWLVLSQAFMLALWSAILNQLFNSHLSVKWIMLGIVDGMGIIFSAGSFASIRAAQREVDELRDSFLTLYPQDFSARDPSHPQKTLLPRLTARKHFHIVGHALPTLMPILLTLMWLGLLLITIVQAVQPDFNLVS